MLDEYVWGHVGRISPEAPVAVLNVVRKESTLGGAGNVVKNLRSLGTGVAIVGAIGEDSTGKRVTELLQVLGVDASGMVEDPHRSSTLKTRLMSLEHGRQVFRLDEETIRAVSGTTEEQIVDLVRQKSAATQAVVCSDYSKGVLTRRVLDAAFATAHEQGIPAIVAPKGRTPLKYAGAHILMLNVHELAQLVGTRPDGTEWLFDSARRLTEVLRLRALVVTRGGEGMSLFEPAQGSLRRVDIPTVAKSVYDVTGAGDTALAAFASAVTVGASHEDATRLANIAAGVSVGKRGTVTVTNEEIKCILQETGNCPALSTHDHILRGREATRSLSGRQLKGGLHTDPSSEDEN